MAANCCVLIVLLIYSYHIYEVSTAAQNPSAGIKGGTTPTLFSSAGGPVTLPCENVLYQSCSSTTWIYSAGSSGTVEVVGHGQVKKDSPTKRTGRFRVESDCSLHMTNVTAEDAGLYTCQQFPEEGGHQQGANAPVYLTVLQVYASGGVTQIEAGSDVTLYCLLQTHDRCGRTVENKGVNLTWVDNGGMELHSTNSRVIRTTSACNITVTERVLDLNPFEKERWWTCQLTADGRVQASATYTIPRRPVTTMIVIVAVASLLLVSAVVIIAVICKRRTRFERGTQDIPDQNRIYATVNESANEQIEDLHYASFDHLNEATPGHSVIQSDITMTYSTVMPPAGENRSSRGPVDPNVLYATVNKTDRRHI